MLALCIPIAVLRYIFEYPLTLGIDDANIFFVYAKNLVNGDGFVYNAGGERVEGFSSFLWMLINAVFFAVSHQPEWSLLIFNILVLGFGLTVAVCVIQDELATAGYGLQSQIIIPLLYLFFLFSAPFYLIWNTITLMENSLWSTLLLLTSLLITKRSVSANENKIILMILLFLILLTRPESYLWVFVFISIVFIKEIAKSEFRQAINCVKPLIFVVIGTIIGLTAFRILYFGYPLPNTYYAKVSASLAYNFGQGRDYLKIYMLLHPLLMIVIPAIIVMFFYLIVAIFQFRPLKNGTLFLSAICCVGLFIPFLVGGDHFIGFRHYQSIYPTLLLAFIVCVVHVLPIYINMDTAPRTLQAMKSWPVLLCGCALVAGFGVNHIQQWRFIDSESQMRREFDIAEENRYLGQIVQKTFQPLEKLPSIGVIAAGGFKFAYDGEVIDLMGLNNIAMAHNGGDRVGTKNHAAFEKKTFFQLEPDILALELVPNDNWEFNLEKLQSSWGNVRALKGLYNDPEFLDRYTYATVSSLENNSPTLMGWFKNEYLTELDRSTKFNLQMH